MPVTPAQLLSLAIARHHQPWNWSLHFAALLLLCLALLFHGYLLLAAAMILFGAGFFPLNLSTPKKNRWFAFVQRRIEAQKDWTAQPWTGPKVLRLTILCMVLLYAAWALWVREWASLGLLLGFAALYPLIAENRAGGIKP